MKGKGAMRFRIAVLIVALIISTIALLGYRNMIYEKMQVQLTDNLKDVAVQNKITMEKELNAKQELLESIGSQIERDYVKIRTNSEIPEIIDFLEEFAEVYHFKRMGVITMDGTAYCTDGYVHDLSTSEAYLFGKQGVANITSSIMDEIGEQEPINVFSVPLINAESGDILAVLFATCKTEYFKNLLNVDSFEGQGYSYIIETDGTVVTDSKKSPMYGTENVFESMLRFSYDNQEVIEHLQAAIEKKESGYATFTTVNKRYLYYAPLDVESVHQDWYLYTIVPANVLDDRSTEILRLHNMVVILIAIVVVVSFVFYIWTYKKDAKALRTLAYVDPITEGDNYPCFVEKMKSKAGDKGYYISADLNEFKLVNSTCGVLKGNETIKCVWEIIKEHLKSDELAAHINADHYVMFLKSDSKEEVIERIKHISDEIEWLAPKINIISILPYFGIYETTSLEDPEASYSHANQAKHLVKGNRKQNWAFYEEVDYQKVVEEKALEDAFEVAIEKHEFEMWYQPKYSSQDESIVGAEALVRWRKQDGSLIPPYRFIPLFERNGMITVLDEYVFRTVCMQQKKWEKEGRQLFPISINISRASLYYNNVVEKYKEILEECDMKAELVPLEITESATIDNAQIRELVDDFRTVGFPMHLDDFGNGYSSLATLNVMHFDTLKLDKSLVDFVGDPNGEKLLWYTIKLAKSLGMHITAEGVEHKEQVEFLQQLQCDEIQGYYYSKPLPLAEFEELLK